MLVKMAVDDNSCMVVLLKNKPVLLSKVGESKVGENKVGESKLQVNLRYSRGNNIILRNVTKTEIKSHNSTGQCPHSRVTQSKLVDWTACCRTEFFSIQFYYSVTAWDTAWQEHQQHNKQLEGSCKQLDGCLLA
eukprot:GFUD01041930.1.p1 GENE.GFUD01041930.1~~GFUD01041930.1.p1  ORF type:complete len:134 (+),score=21.06 GFUD01041930.1:77-478(+)